MVYYTDADRARAARARRQNRRNRALIESPEDARDIRNDMYRDALGISLAIPKVEKKPQLSDFNLPVNVDAVINESDVASLTQKKEIAKNKFVWSAAFILLIGLAFCIFVPSLAILALIVVPITLMVKYSSVSAVKPDRTNTHINYDNYKKNLDDYKYWDRKKSIIHWNKLSGHAFEASVASLFKAIGFSAVVSRRGGDGGIDIVLTKAGRRIAVQCKRYNKPVGPHIIRDLWGTMNALGYSEGCIVTTTGFTSGVKNFAVGKNIFLIDLNDILRAVGENGDVYLSRKIGEQIAPTISSPSPPPSPSNIPHPRTYTVYRSR